MSSTAQTHAVVAHGRDDVRRELVDVPEPGPGDAVIAVAYGGVCGSDIHYWRDGAAGDSVLKVPMVLGHEISGIVARPAADGTGPAAGTPVTVHPVRREPTDVRFPADRPNLSPGVRYLGSAARFPHTDGGFADTVVLPAMMLRPLPDGLDLRTAVLAEPASVAWHAVGRAGRIAGARVLVVGSGPIGALIVAACARAGAAEIVAVDMHDTPLTIATQVGAPVTRTLRATDADAIAACDADVVFEASGNPRGLASALRGATRGGTVVMVGLQPAGDQPVPISLAISHGLQLLGTFRFHDEIDDVVAALADGSLRAGPVITHEFPAADVVEALRVAADSSVSGKVILRFGAAPSE